MMFDLRFAIRGLLRHRTFTVVALLTLALGIGVNAAMFTVVNAVLLRPLPYEHADRLVMVWQDLRLLGGPADEWATPGNLADWRRASNTFDGVAAFTGWLPSVSGDDQPEQLVGAQVTANYFDVLGTRMLRGRPFQRGEDLPNAPRVAILTYGLWERRFGGDPAIVGRDISLGGVPHRIVGVLPRDFRPALAADAALFRPLQLNLAEPSRGAVILRVIGRLHEGVSLDAARAQADVLARQLEAAFPDTNHLARISLVPLKAQIVGKLTTSLLVLFGAVGVVLLIACANVASLVLARGFTRERELAVRTALGASRGRIVRLLLTEGAALALGGGALGLLFAAWTVDTLLRLVPPGLPRFDDVSIDARVLLFAAAVSALTVLVFGLGPAWRVARARSTATLKEGQRTTGAHAGRLRQALVVAQVALATVLVVGALLLVRSFQAMQAADLGIDAQNVLAARLAPPPAKFRTPELRTALYDRILERAAALPGVANVALTTIVPFNGDSDTSFEIEGRPASPREGEQPVAWYRSVSGAYFDVLGVRVLRGRGLDANEPSPVVVVNETMARRYWPGEDPIGKRLRINEQSPWVTIVGVVSDVRTRGAAEPPQVEMFAPYQQLPDSPMWVLLRTAPSARLHGGAPRGQTGVDIRTLVAPLRDVVKQIDRDTPVSSTAPLAEVLGRPLAQPRFLAMLSSLFGALAVCLAACGLYGVMAYSVSQRTGEIGVRMALGAGSREVLALVIGQGLRLALVGIALGTVAAVATSRALRSLLFEVSPADPLALLAGMVGIAVIAVLAALVPAGRAARVDPLRALRAE